jgi:acyl carrier protein
MRNGNLMRERIRTFVLSKYPGARKQAVTDSSQLLETGVIDSLGVLDLLGFLEQTFSINVADDELVPENFQTIDRIVTFVQSKQTARR